MKSTQRITDATEAPEHQRADVEDALDKDYAPAWRPDAGDKLVGIVADLSEREGAYGVYPIVTVIGEDGEPLAVHAFHEVLRSELARLRPKVGDQLGIKYVGKDPDRGYHLYRVRRGGADEGVDWAKYAEAEDEFPNAKAQHEVDDDVAPF